MLRTSHLLTAAGALAAGATAFTYRRELKNATRRIETRRQLADGIEFAESGDGPAVLVIHGAGGGFDQGLLLGRGFLGDGYRIVAPSRFGYLGTPMPADASPEAQSDAHLRLVDALRLERVPVIGVSAGGPSAMQFALRHADRCDALVLIVPLTYAPDNQFAVPLRSSVLKAIMASDFAFWAATRVAHSTLVETILGTPLQLYRDASSEARRDVDDFLRSILPISRRIDGMLNDGEVSSHLTRYQLEDIRVPTLLIAAADCGYGTYAGSVYTAKEIPNATLIAFATGGHLLVGHADEVRTQIRAFLRRPLESRKVA